MASLTVHVTFSGLDLAKAHVRDEITAYEAKWGRMPPPVFVEQTVRSALAKHVRYRIHGKPAPPEA